MTVTSMLLIITLFLVAGLGAFIEVMRILFVFLAARGIVKGESKKYRESIKTSTYTLAGWVIAAIALFCYYSTVNIEPPDINERENKPLFVGFEPIDVKRLEIVSFDREGNRFNNFRVEQQGIDLWRIPSHQNYPADALQQVQNAANSLINLTVIEVVPQTEVDEKLFGVVEPDPSNVSSGQEGVGTMVMLRDKSNRELASLIIGKPLKNEPERRFVRIPGQEPVYVVEYDLTVLKTDFREWIEKDLLLLDEINIDQVSINDYQVDPDLALAQNRLEITRNYDFTVKSEFGVWELVKFIIYDDQKTPEDRPIRPGERLNFGLLDVMKKTLDELQIVDVKRKPEGLSADLTAGTSFLQDESKREQRLSLALHGFLPRATGEGYEILSSNGELVVQTRSGIEYVLRFGRIRTDAPQERTDGKLERYLMVTTRVNDDAFPMPIKEQQASNDDSGAPPPPGGGQDAAAGDDDERRRIDREYQRQVDERNDRLNQAGEIVRILNNRFSDWYYVISEDDYLKLKIPRRDLLTRQVAPVDDPAVVPSDQGDEGNSSDDQ